MAKSQRMTQVEEAIKEILGPDGKVQASQTAIERVEREHPNATPAEKMRLAQATTLIEVYEKHMRE